MGTRCAAQYCLYQLTLNGHCRDFVWGDSSESGIQDDLIYSEILVSFSSIQSYVLSIVPNPEREAVVTKNPNLIR